MTKAKNAARKPRQKRSEQTISRIMKTTAQLLEEGGVDKLNTNLICERAGLTPPALYHYFPNKYAILAALGEQMMEVQNEALLKSVGENELTDNPKLLAAGLRKQYDVTISLTGAAAIMRALYATPQLSEVRLKSHRWVVDLLVDVQKKARPDQDEETVIRKAKILLETGYKILETLVDDPTLDVDDTIEDVARMLSTLVAD